MEHIFYKLILRSVFTENMQKLYTSILTYNCFGKV